VIFQSANEMMQSTLLRNRLDEIQSQAQSEKEWWEKRRASIQSDFMKEIEDTGSRSRAGTLADRIGSDEDAVLVEVGGHVNSGKGSARKRKGKK
jgi:translocation protein SEC66